MKLKINSHSSSGFTLIELLVVTALVALLASLLFHTLARAKSAAKNGACLSNLHQMGLAMEMYIEENNNRLPSCSSLPDLSANDQPSIVTTLQSQLPSRNIWRCPVDRDFFASHQASYEWNQYLNGASYDHPEDWSPATQSIVETIFGGRLNTPLLGDAVAFHGTGGINSSKNTLYFDGRVAKGKL